MTPMTRKQKQEAARRLATMNSAIGAIMRLSAEVENIRAQDVDEWLDDLARVEEVAAELGGVEERNILRAMPDLQMIKTQLSAQPSRHRRNPPLPEHMAHDDLDEIAQGLALRIAQSKNPALDFRVFVRAFSYKTVDALQGDPSFERMTDAMLSAMALAHR